MPAILGEIYFIYMRNLKTWLAVPANVISPLFISGLLFVIFGATFDNTISLGGFGTGDYQAFLVAWIIVQVVVFSGADSGFALLTDIMSGYFDKLLLAPINRFSILFASLMVSGTRALLQALVVVVLALGMGVDFQGGALGILAMLVLAVAFGLVWSCLGIMIALKTRNAQVTQTSGVLFFPFIFLTTAFMPEEQLSGWFKVAVKINPVTYVMEAMRAIVVEGWDWDTILTGVWVAGLMMSLLLIATTWMYRRQTA
ncbi:MAG: ABC transporter permease [SAR202 cluster bacterium]|nr:ABC transporter [Chloroflexota bacterium]MQF94067.1 ABC transporter permease [SAR202 cluster bacterium]HCL25254.1 ABC transporter [Dehalococcoidia bacterium]MBO19467.1 ABC transporter [Chloroflexota bacterium]MQG33060.1 ABC transporter permease [SAR202 cluster bacterium]|tara:strand:+ start:385 stop:1152 length:768 start_codon:yes stop_codon:yes gene_type:complete